MLVRSFALAGFGFVALVSAGGACRHVTHLYISFNVVNRLKKRVRALEKTNLICYYSRDEFTAYYPTWRQS